MLPVRLLSFQKIGDLNQEVASCKLARVAPRLRASIKNLMDPADTFSQRFSRAEMDTLDTQETKEISTKQERRLEELRLEKLKVRLAVLLERVPRPA